VNKIVVELIESYMGLILVPSILAVHLSVHNKLAYLVDMMLLGIILLFS